MLLSLVGVLMTTMLTIWGCGGSSSTGSGSYPDPAATAKVTTTVTASKNALVTAPELKAWLDEGKVNAPFGSYDRVVILDLTSSPATTVVTDATKTPPTTTTITDDTKNTYYTTGHIPEAQLISAGANAFMETSRAEGPLNTTGNMVCNGKTMDALVQKTGIDANTTIVLTSSTNTINMTRAYATLRYWGFAKNRIKVLQGGNAAWTAAGYTFTKAVPVIKASNYCVAPDNTTKVNTDMRVSLSEMITYVKNIIAGNPNKIIVLDTIRPDTQISSTTDLIDAGYTPFEGAMKGSYRFPYANVVTSGLYFKDAATLKNDISAGTAYNKTTLGDANRDAAKTFIVFCRAGNAASVAYFALDGIAYYDSNIDIKWYDGSLGQWNTMVTKDRTAVDTTGKTVNAGGQLAVGSIWDTTALMDNLTWTVGTYVDPKATPPVQRSVVKYDNRVYAVEPSFADGNQIETEDKAYRSTVNSSTGSGTAGGSGC